MPKTTAALAVRAYTDESAGAKPARRPRATVLPHFAKRRSATTGVPFHEASVLELIDLEQSGVDSSTLRLCAERLGLPVKRIFEIVGVPRATAAKKLGREERLTGGAGYAALGLLRLISMAQEMVANSTHADAKGFDAGRWLGQWLESSQPALGGRRPSDVLSSPTGLQVVIRLLGALQSGSYQ